MATVNGQTIINNALTKLGVLEQGGAPNASDSQYGLNELNAMWEAWGIDEGLIYAVVTNQYPLTGAPNYTLGPGGAINAVRPARIEGAISISGGIRRPIALVDQKQYFSHGDLSTSGKIVEELYPDYNDDANGRMTLYVYPAAQNGGTLELETSVPFNAWTLAGAYIIPPGYQDAIEWALAFRMMSGFGVIVTQQVAQVVTAAGAKAEARLREANAKNRMMPPAPVANPAVAEQGA